MRGTGHEGVLNAQRMCSELAVCAGVKSEQVLPFSTGVIGETLPIEKIVSAIPQSLK